MVSGRYVLAHLPAGMLLMIGALVSVSGERRNFCLAKVAKYFPNPVKKSGIGETLFAKEVLAKPFPRKSKKLGV